MRKRRNINFLSTKTQTNDFQMAWKSLEEEAMNIVGKHMQVMRLEKKRQLNELCA